MSLTPEQISAFDKVSGLQTDPNAVPITPASSSRADAIRAIGASNPSPPAPSPESGPDFSLGGIAKGLLGPVATMVARPFQAGAELLGASSESVDKFSNKYSGGLVAPVPQNAADVKKDAGRAVQTVALGAPGLVSGGAAFGLGNSLEQGNDLFSGQTLFQTVLGAGAGKVLGLIGEPIFNAAGKVISKITPDFLSNIAKQGAKAIEDFAASHNILPEGVSNAINKGANKAESILSAPLNKAESKITTGVNSAKDFVENKIKGKALEDIKNTPPDQVYKLNKNERTAYFNNQKELIANQEHEANRAVMEDLNTKSEAATQQIKDLSKEADTVTHEKALELKPKVVRAFGEQSQTYRAIRDEEMAPFKDTKLTTKEINNKIDETFKDSPQTAEDIKSRLGLDPKKGTTIGELDAKMKGMRQDVGTAAKKGTRVYTPDELNTDKALQGMNDLLKEKGVDLSKSNKFWKEWAPLRDKLVTKLKPFDVGGYETKPFAKLLKDSASEKGDMFNAQFIKDTEDLLGEPITKETKAVMAKITTVQKQQLASEIAAESEKLDISMLKDKSLKSLSETAFAAERAARMRLIVKGALALGADKWIKAKTGIGF